MKTASLLLGDESTVTDFGMLLAIDTSAERAGIAIWDGAALHESQWPADRRHTTGVMPRIEALLSGVGRSAPGLCGVAVAQGPGTFTGLRVGMSLAKGFAISLGIPIFGIPTLNATALPWTLAGRTVVAVLPAGRGRLVWQRISPSDHPAHPVNGNPDELLTALADMEVDAVVGELPAPLRAALAHAPVPVLGEPGLASRVGAVALIGRQRLLSGHVDDLATLEPIYVHGTQTPGGPSS
jgi:tRNA threonylcarbamoyladenosine biosynthesis protein TsaB